jgi:CHAT domain-containing protein
LRAAAAAPHIAEHLYGHASSDAAVALHNAVLALGQQPEFANPIAWAPYVHFGP